MRRQLATLIEGQHGRVARRQLIEHGLSYQQIDRRLRAGRLRLVHRGVYAVAGTPATREGHWMAAVLAAGPGAALSHRSAAELWALLPGCSSPVHVTVPGAGGRARRRGLLIHRSEAPVTQHRGIPVTDPLRTLRDMKTGRLTFERAVAEAHRRRLISQAAAEALLPDGNPTQNDFEEAFLAICRDHGIPLPRRQQLVAGYAVDFLWPAQLLVVETDGHGTHGTRPAFEEDRARDAELATRGYRVLRFTWRQLTRKPGWVAEIVKRAL